MAAPSYTFNAVAPVGTGQTYAGRNTGNILIYARAEGGSRGTLGGGGGGSSDVQGMPASAFGALSGEVVANKGGANATGTNRTGVYVTVGSPRDSAYIVANGGKNGNVLTGGAGGDLTDMSDNAHAGGAGANGVGGVSGGGGGGGATYLADGSAASGSTGGNDGDGLTSGGTGSLAGAGGTGVRGGGGGGGVSAGVGCDAVVYLYLDFPLTNGRLNANGKSVSFDLPGTGYIPYPDASLILTSINCSEGSANAISYAVVGSTLTITFDNAVAFTSAAFSIAVTSASGVVNYDAVTQQYGFGSEIFDNFVTNNSTQSGGVLGTMFRWFFGLLG